MSTVRPAPGWYTDPADPAWQRYWDGTAWTVHRRPLPPSSEPSREPAKSWPQRIAEWFETGTAAVRFAKAVVSLLAAGGLIAGGVVVNNIIVNGGQTHVVQGPTGGGQAGGNTGGGSVGGGGSNSGATLSSTLLQPCDLGECNSPFGWIQTQAPTSTGPLPSCPTFPPTAVGHVGTVLLNNTTAIEVFEDIWRVADPGQVVSTYVNTAQGCSFTNSQDKVVTFQADDSGGSYGDKSAVFSLGVTDPGLPGETPTIGSYEAVIAKGNLVATVLVKLGTSGIISGSDLSAIFTATTRRLL
jgi:hypothetical protein